MMTSLVVGSVVRVLDLGLLLTPVRQRPSGRVGVVVAAGAYVSCVFDGGFNLPRRLGPFEEKRHVCVVAGLRLCWPRV